MIASVSNPLPPTWSQIGTSPPQSAGPCARNHSPDEERALAEAALVRITMTATMPVCLAAGDLKGGVANSAWSVPDVEFVDCRDQLRAGVEARHDDGASRGRSGICSLPLDKMPPQRRVRDRRGRGSLGENGEIAG